MPRKTIEEYETFLLPITKEVKRINKNGNEITKNISYKLNVIDSESFITSLLSNIIDKLVEGIHKIKCKHRHDNKKCETCGIQYKSCECCLEYTNIKNDLIEYKCVFCNKNYQKKKFDQNLTKRFANAYKFSKININKFIMLL